MSAVSPYSRFPSPSTAPISRRKAIPSRRDQRRYPIRPRALPDRPTRATQSLLYTRNNDVDPVQPTRSANTVAGIRGVTTNKRRTSFSNASNDDPAGLRSYFGAVSAANARSTVPRETPSCFANSRLEIFSFA